MRGGVGRAVLAGALSLATALADGQTPSGQTPSSQASSGLAAATWSAAPGPDAFSAAALLDLRGLNEAIAGQSGFVRIGRDGGFERGDGAPLRFWAVNTEVGRGGIDPAAPDLARHARFLAKRGVNMVRLHRQLAPNLAVTPDAAIGDIDAAERDGIWRTVAAMRREGIYTALSPYWAGPMHFAPAWAIAGGAQQSAYGLLFVDPVLQSAYKSWLRRLLTEKNPYTGMALAKDPSLALIQIQNEDSLLFWTVGSLGPAQRQALEARFGAFLLKKYGSPWNLQSAWLGEPFLAGAAATPPRVPLLDLSELTGPGRGAHGRRLADQTEFYARTMHDFNAEVVRYLRDDLGAMQLVNAGNWKTASPARLGDAERWSYTAGDVDAANVYTGGVHQGPNSGWAIQNGDRFTDESVLLHPRNLPTNLKQTLGRPMLVTEGGWILPNGHATEGPFLVAAYASLSGVAGYTWFSTRDEGYGPPQSANGYLPSQAKWTFATPDVLGTFAAAALAYRRGDIRRGTPVLVENRTLQDLWDRKTAVLAEEASFDPNRDAGDIAPRSAVKTAIAPDAFLVGPAWVAFGADPALSRAGPTAGLVAPGVVRANTGQIVLNSRLGFCTLDAPRAQGVAAHFSAAPTHQLTDVRFTSGNAYGAAMAVSLDDAPLRDSRKILLQFGTRSRPTGWLQAPVRVEVPGQGAVDGWEVKSYGHAPWQVESARLQVTIDNPTLVRATALDLNGMPMRAVALERSATAVTLTFPPDALYVVVEH